MTNSNLSEKMSLVNGLLLECPLDKPLDDCPAKEVRSLPAKKRLKVVEAMGESELDLIISHHRYCFQKRRMEQLYLYRPLFQPQPDYNITEDLLLVANHSQFRGKAPSHNHKSA